jgi:hypothetical protein
LIESKEREERGGGASRPREREGERGGAAAEEAEEKLKG